MARTTTTALRKNTDPDPRTVEGIFGANQAAMARALTGHMTPKRMLSLTLTELRRNTSLQKCTPQSVFAAVLQAGQLGLEPSGALGHAYLVPYKTECQLIIGYRGMIELAMRSGKVKRVMARCVYSEDHFEVHLGTEERIEHVPMMDGDRGELIATYAVAEMKDGTMQFDVLTRETIEAHRNRSKAKNAGPWVTDYEEMARKTSVRALAKYLPSNIISTEMAEQVEAVEHGITIDVVPEAPEVPEAPKPIPAPPPKAVQPPPAPEPSPPPVETENPAPPAVVSGVSGSTKDGPMSKKGEQLRSLISKAEPKDADFLRDLIKDHNIGDEQGVLTELLEEMAAAPVQGEIE